MHLTLKCTAYWGSVTYSEGTCSRQQLKPLCHCLQRQGMSATNTCARRLNKLQVLEDMLNFGRWSTTEAGCHLG